MYKRPKYIISTSICHTIPFHDVDSMKVVWHGHYLKYFEMAREALIQKIGFDYTKLEKLGLVCPIVDVQCQYRHSIKVLDNITINAYLIEIEAKFIVAYEIFNNDNILCCYGKTTQIYIQKEDNSIIYTIPSALEFLQQRD